MAYAIIEEGGKQYQVKEGDLILIELRDAEPGVEIRFDRVLLYSDGAQVQVGKPTVPGVTVTGTVKREAKGPKTITLKYRRRANSSQRKVGGRQKLLAVQITKVG